MGNPFAQTTDVRPVGTGRYHAELDERWNLRPLPQGGIVTAIPVRAMEIELDHDEQQPRTLHTTFAAQVAHGSLDIDVDVLRAGRSISQVRAEVRNAEAERGHLTTCVFGSRREGFACRSPWVLAHNRARFAGDGYASADMALWDCGDEGRDEPRLVAYATQLFLFTFFD